ncbi:anti-sigma factor [Rhizobium sp. TRM95111]|uniref:anti-sigma factor family protein n=1 Tax=Rhizobium alarense TaxID=2846851 RepID=UPI001F388F15|nr:anti-sigma factor [Rhizobium alarense]MCF3640557.1 anti-sigma factor [Rhizobium alarense]
MSEDSRSVTEDDLHAYVDGLLDAAATARVEAWLPTHAEDAALVEIWRTQNGLIRTAFSAEPAPRPGDRDLVLEAGRASNARQRPRRAMAAAAVLLFAAGAVAGAVATGILRAPDENASLTVASLPQQARSAYLIYASEVRHPVEVGANEKQHLAQWLGKRLDYDLTVPDLAGLGFSLLGGRLVPVDGQAGALFLYQNAEGKRVAIMLGRDGRNRETSFRYASDGPVETFYWIDGPIGYAVTGEVSRPVLEAIAEECYRQFEG